MVHIVFFPNTAVKVAQKLAASFPKTDVEMGVISSLVSYVTEFSIESGLTVDAHTT